MRPTDLLIELTRAREQNEGTGTALLRVLPDDARNAAMRCSTVASFGSELYGALLDDDPTRQGPLLEALQGLGVVETAGPGRHRITAHMRGEVWRLWWNEAEENTGNPPAELHRLAETLAAHFRVAGAELEWLSQLVLCNPEGAERLFERLFTAADEAFNLPACEDALAHLAPAAGAGAIPPRFAERAAQCRLRIAARSVWDMEYRVTHHYLSRRTKEDALLSFLQSDSRESVLWLHANPGFGKTTQLNWLIARHCARQEPPLPCAMVDLGTVHTAMANHPWLLLVHAAAQLDRQLPDAPFRDLLDTYRDHLPALHPLGRAWDGGRSAAPGPVDWPVSFDEDDDGSEDSDNSRTGLVAREFGRLLAEAAWQDRPAVVVFDTVENVWTRMPGVLDRIARMVRTTCEAARPDADGPSRVRFVLAGRVGPEAVKQSALGGVVPLSLEPFTADEQRRYLTDVRGLAPQADITRAILERCRDGIPFILALYAKIAETPDVTANSIRETNEPRLLYAIIRGLLDLPEELRVPVLYGAVPRWLTRDFLRMEASHLAERPPAQNLLDLLKVDQATLLPADLDGVWPDIVQHARGSNWQVVPGDPPVIRLRPEIRQPLCDMLLDADPGLLADLHDRAATHFAARAADGPQREPGQPDPWDYSLREACYHRFQRCAAVKRLELAPQRHEAVQRHEDAKRDAVQAWRDAIAEARRRDRPDVVELLAQDVMDDDFRSTQSGPDGRLPPPDGPAAVAEPDTDRMPVGVWYEANLRLAEVHEAKAESLPPTRREEEWRLARVYLDAAMVRENALADYPDKDALRSRWTELDAEYRLAVEGTGDSIGVTASPSVTADAAPAHDLATLDLVSSASDPLETQVRALMAIWHPTAALAKLSGNEGEEADAVLAPGTMRYLRASALASLLQPMSALSTLTATPVPAAASAGDWDHWRRVRLTAQVHGDLLKYQSAVMEFRRCLGLGPEPLSATDLEKSGVALRLGLFYLEQQGSLLRATNAFRQARKYLPAERDRAPAQQEQATLLRAAILLAQAAVAGLHHSQEATGQAVKLVDAADKLLDTRSPTEPDRTPLVARRAVAALRGLAIERAEDRSRLTFLRRLTTCLDELPSAAARLWALERLGDVPDFPSTRFPSLQRWGREWRRAIDKFRVVVERPELPSDAAAPTDEALRGLVHAEIARLIGEKDDAENLARTACERLSAHDPFVWWHLLSRHRWIQAEIPAHAVATFREQYASTHPHLVGAFLVEVTHRRWERGEADAALPAEAAGLLLRTRVPSTRWHVRLCEAQARTATQRDRTRHLEDRTRHRLALGYPAERAVQAEGAALLAEPTEVILRIVDSIDEKISVSTSADKDDRPLVELKLPRQIRDADRASYFVLQLDSDTREAGRVDSLETWSRLPEFSELRDALRSALERATKTRPVCDVRIEIADPRLARVPWEVLHIPTAERPDGVSLPRQPAVRYVYRAVAAPPGQRTEEGRRAGELTSLRRVLVGLGELRRRADGGDTSDGELSVAVRRFQRKQGLTSGPVDTATWQRLWKVWNATRIGGSDPPRVALVVLQTEYAARADAVESVHGAYRDCGIQPHVVRAASEGELQRDLAQIPMDALHLVGEMTGRAADPAFMFHAAETPLFASDLSLLLRRIGGPPPLVVLDVRRPVRRLSTIKQLVLRNEFAHQLLSFGDVCAVLAAGLRGDDDQSRHLHQIPEAIAAGRSPASLRNELHGSGVEELAGSSVALFSAVCPDALVPPGLADGDHERPRS